MHEIKLATELLGVIHVIANCTIGHCRTWDCVNSEAISCISEFNGSVVIETTARTVASSQGNRAFQRLTAISYLKF
jgi:hypothetical protein